MTKRATVFIAEYRARGYVPEETALLRQILEELGAVRLRPLRPPEAGGVAELWLVVSFVGGTMLSGLIEHLTGKAFDRLSDGLVRFFKSRTDRDGTSPEMTLTVSYDDVDLAIGPVGEEELRHLPRLAKKVYEVLTSRPLEDLPVTRIVIGMIRRQDEWEEPHLWECSKDGERFWGISVEGHRGVTHILDTQTMLLAPMPGYEDPPPYNSGLG